tara:strand:- start:70 stop:321 length:252 start_codon:yes stop_codon:yes gene_type:complete
MASKIDAILSINPNAQFTTKDGVIEWLNGTAEISNADIQAKKVELDTAEANKITEKENLKASAKAKLIAGEALTEDEANTIVL